MRNGLHNKFDEERVKVSSNNTWLEVKSATVVEVEGLLRMEYRVFKHANSDEHAACHNYSLPLEVAEHVDFVMPTIQPNVNIVKVPIGRGVQPLLPLSRRDANVTSNAANVSTSNVLSGCNTQIVPSCLKALYNMTYTPKMAANNSVGVVSYYSNSYLQSDLDLFFGNFSPALVGSSPTLMLIDGALGTIALDASSSVGEDDWILSYLMTLSDSPQSVQFLTIGNQQTGSFFSINEWLDAVDGSYCTSDGGNDLAFNPQLPNPFPGGFNNHSCGTVKVPNIISVSQAVEEITYTDFYKQCQCNEFVKLGLMGVTVLYAAANTGTAGAARLYCLDDNGSVTLNGMHFSLSWPASCPWVTAVGGTQVKSNTTLGQNPEEVWNQDRTMGFFESGGGGFSQKFAKPAYQKDAVSNYLKFLAKNDLTTLQHFNNHGRAYPDISANACVFVTCVVLRTSL
ncbi:hypothetical protein D9619_008189 [Psilocybe cf. subviscida]|uniref:Peptidase S53 domain-containing protein n=1 Tax=Psilocybe cf. subviscida TaxID=2480587 RepID=A0A8H5ATU4_9AGAR|nr:hypothetical protein D9619_008189 [Psilocybe cf. subviscida]